jgi:fatty-acyl-CoA synthase
LGVLAAGACLVKAVTFDAGQLLGLLQGQRATILSAVPTMIIAMLQKHEEQGQPVDTANLRTVISGGTPIPVPVMEQVHRVWGAQPMIGFGMTETSPMVTGTLAADTFERKSATVGIPLPHTEVQIIDAAGERTPIGVPGELLIRGYLVTRGYYKMPECTAETIDADGWLHSGDLASLDAEGYVRIVGRLKDMIIRGGENVYPAEIEALLMRHAAVGQAQVVGVADPYMGEEAAVFVQVREGASLSEEDLRAYCRQALARHKQPKYVRFVEQFPLTPSGKVKKYELRQAIEAELPQAS